MDNYTPINEPLSSSPDPFSNHQDDGIFTSGFIIECALRLLVFGVGLYLLLMGPYFDFEDYYSNIVAIVIGVLLITLAPAKLYRHFENRIYEDPDTTLGEWRPFPTDKMTELLNMIEPKTMMSRGGSRKMAGGVIAGFITSLFVSIWLSAMLIGSFEFDIPPTLITAIAFVIFTLIRLGTCFGIVPHQLSIMVNPLQVFQSCVIPQAFSKRFEAQIVNDVNGDPDILNVRMQVTPKDPIKGLLCIMVTISRTKVKENTYPFPYIVVVFGGTRLFSRTDIENHLTQAITPPFRIELSSQDGNNVAVILPAKGLYTLTLDGCIALSEILKNICNVCDSYRHDIERYCIIPKQ